MQTCEKHRRYLVWVVQHHKGCTYRDLQAWPELRDFSCKQLHRLVMASPEITVRYVKKIPPRKMARFFYKG